MIVILVQCAYPFTPRTETTANPDPESIKQSSRSTKNRTHRTRTPDPYVIHGVDYRKYRIPKIHTSHFVIHNDNPWEITVSNVSVELVKRSKKWRHTVLLEDVFVDPYKTSDPYAYDYMLVKWVRNRWRISIECNHTGYICDPVWCEINEPVDRFDPNAFVNISVNIQRGYVSFTRPWITNETERVVYSPLQGLGIITTKGKWW